MRKITIVKTIVSAFIGLTVQAALADTLCWDMQSNKASYRSLCRFNTEDPDGDKRTYLGYVDQESKTCIAYQSGKSKNTFWWLRADKVGLERFPASHSQNDFVNTVPYCPGIKSKNPDVFPESTEGLFSESGIVCKAQKSLRKEKYRVGLLKDAGDELVCSDVFGVTYQFVNTPEIRSVPGWACKTKALDKTRLGKLSGSHHGNKVQKAMIEQGFMFGSKDKDGHYMLGNYADHSNNGDDNVLFKNVNHIDCDVTD